MVAIRNMVGATQRCQVRSVAVSLETKKVEAREYTETEKRIAYVIAEMFQRRVLEFSFVGVGAKVELVVEGEEPRPLTELTFRRVWNFFRGARWPAEKVTYRRFSAGEGGKGLMHFVIREDESILLVAPRANADGIQCRFFVPMGQERHKRTHTRGTFNKECASGDCDCRPGSS